MCIGVSEVHFGGLNFFQPPLHFDHFNFIDQSFLILNYWFYQDMIYQKNVWIKLC